MPRTKEQFEKIREETRAKILNAALELFAKKGYANTSINEIAKSANISKGLVYNYFKSKDMLMEEVIKILFVEIGSMFSILETIKNPFEKVQVMIDLMFDWLEDKEDFWRLYASLLMQSEIKETIEKISGNFLEEMFKEIEKIFSKMKIKNPASEAKIFGAILDGMGFHILFMGNEYPTKKMRKFLKSKYSREKLA